MPKLKETSKASVEDELNDAFPKHSSFVDALTERLQHKTRRSKLFVMRISEAEHNALKLAAKDAGVPVADVIRYAVSLCLIDGVLDPVAKKHLATITRVSKADRDDVRQNRKTLRVTTDEKLDAKIAEELGSTFTDETLHDPIKGGSAIESPSEEKTQTDRVVDDGEVLVDEIYEEI